MSETKRVIYYTSKNGSCRPCTEINKLIETGQFHAPGAEVDLVDITTDEGYQRFFDEVLSKQDGAVPSAYLDGKKCQIILDDGKVFIECPGEEPSNVLPSNPDEKSSPSGEDSSHGASQPDQPSAPLEPQS
jgi:hypothetical protein